MTRQLPRFCMYQIIEKPQQIPEDFTKNSVTAEVFICLIVLIIKSILFFFFFLKRIINEVINIFLLN